MHFEILDDVWIDLVGISVLAGVLLLCFAYVLWCHLGVKARQAPTDGTVKAGIFRLGAARGDLRTMACLLSSAAVDVDAAHGGFTALHTAAVMGQTGEARGSNSAECSETAAPDMECLYHLQACSPITKCGAALLQMLPRGCVCMVLPSAHRSEMVGVKLLCTTQQQKVTQKLSTFCLLLERILQPRTLQVGGATSCNCCMMQQLPAQLTALLVDSSTEIAAVSCSSTKGPACCHAIQSQSNHGPQSSAVSLCAEQCTYVLDACMKRRLLSGVSPLAVGHRANSSCGCLPS